MTTRLSVSSCHKRFRSKVTVRRKMASLRLSRQRRQRRRSLYSEFRKLGTL